MSTDLVTKETSINEIATSVRIYNALTLAHLHTVADVIQYSENDIRKLRNLGRDSMQELKDMLSCYGFALADESKGEIVPIADCSICREREQRERNRRNPEWRRQQRECLRLEQRAEVLRKRLARLEKDAATAKDELACIEEKLAPKDGEPDE